MTRNPGKLVTLFPNSAKVRKRKRTIHYSSRYNNVIMFTANLCQFFTVLCTKYYLYIFLFYQHYLNLNFALCKKKRLNYVIK